MADTTPFTQIAKGHPDWRQIQKKVRAEGHEKAAERFVATLANPEIPRDQKAQQLARQFKDMDQAMGELFASNVRDTLHKKYPDQAETLVKAWLHRKKPDAIQVEDASGAPKPEEFSEKQAQDALDPYKTPIKAVSTSRLKHLKIFARAAKSESEPEPLTWPSCEEFCTQVIEYTPRAKQAILQQLIDSQSEDKPVRLR
jgi:hypothetical protein